MLLIVSGLGDDGLSTIRGPINWAGHFVTFVICTSSTFFRQNRGRYPLHKR